MEAVGLEDVPITSGITELGTTNIMLQTHYDEVADSLVSLANNGDRKQYYKQAMVALLSDELGLPNPVRGFRLNGIGKFLLTVPIPQHCLRFTLFLEEEPTSLSRSMSQFLRR